MWFAVVVVVVVVLIVIVCHRGCLCLDEFLRKCLFGD